MLHPVTPIIEISGDKIVSKNTRPDWNQGNPPSKKYLEISVKINKVEIEIIIIFVRLTLRY